MAINQKSKKPILLFVFALLLCSCSAQGTLTKTKTISRHYTISRASLSEDDYGEKIYNVVTSTGSKEEKHLNFDSFKYYDENYNQIINVGIADYVNLGKNYSYFNFHYDGTCEYQITMLDNTKRSKTGKYTLVDDDISINYSDGTTAKGGVRFGLDHPGIGEGTIVYYRVPISLNIQGEEKVVYIWFWDGIFHESPWGEK